MKISKSIIILLMLFQAFLLVGCDEWYPDDKFLLEKTAYTGNQLRVDGYYYTLRADSIGNTYKEICFFYRNGVLFHLGGIDVNKSVEESLSNAVYSCDYQNDKNRWGLFTIEDNAIRFERYYPSESLKKPLYVREGPILNDTTFIINFSYRSDGSEGSIENEKYYFEKFDSKPDSTNSFFQ